MQNSSAALKSYAAQTLAQSLVGGANEAQTGTWRGNKYIKPRFVHEVIKYKSILRFFRRQSNT